MAFVIVSKLLQGSFCREASSRRLTTHWSRRSGPKYELSSKSCSHGRRKPWRRDYLGYNLTRSYENSKSLKPHDAASRNLINTAVSSLLIGPITPSVGFLSSNLGRLSFGSASSISYRCNTSATKAKTSLLAMNLLEQYVIPLLKGLKSGLLPIYVPSRNLCRRNSLTWVPNTASWKCSWRYGISSLVSFLNIFPLNCVGETTALAVEAPLVSLSVSLKAVLSSVQRRRLSILNWLLEIHSLVSFLIVASVDGW